MARTTCRGERGRLGCALPTDGFVVGNVKHHSILEVWRSEKSRSFKEVRQEQFKGTVCEDCPTFQECYVEKGGCLVETLKAYGSRFHPHPACPKAPNYGSPLR